MFMQLIMLCAVKTFGLKYLKMKPQQLKKLLIFMIIFFFFSATNAQIIYTDVKPDIKDSCSGTGCSQNYYLDLNNDGIKDFKIFLSSKIGPSGFSCPPTKSAQIKSLNSNEVVKDKLSANTIINQQSSFDTGAYLLHQVLWSQSHAEGNCTAIPSGKWADADGYIGLKLKKAGQVYYGWVRLNVSVSSSSASFTVKDYAYNSAAGEAIKAGEGQIPLCNCRQRPRPPGCGAACGPFTSQSNETPEKLIVEATQVKISLNPFSNSTTISFSLPQSQKAMPAARQVSIQIFDMNGRLIRTLADAQMQPGAHQLMWNAKDEKGNTVTVGIYFLRMQSGNYTGTKKLVVVK
jgi:hypothetical protein